jgi:hypothetical protein
MSEDLWILLRINVIILSLITIGAGIYAIITLLFPFLGGWIIPIALILGINVAYLILWIIGTVFK